QLESASSIRQYRLACETSIEGLHYIRAARTAMGMDPGPEVPALPGQRGVGSLSEPVSAEVEGRSYTGSPTPDDENRHYYPGGRGPRAPFSGGRGPCRSRGGQRSRAGPTPARPHPTTRTATTTRAAGWTGVPSPPAGTTRRGGSRRSPVSAAPWSA